MSTESQREKAAKRIVAAIDALWPCEGDQGTASYAPAGSTSGMEMCLAELLGHLEARGGDRAARALRVRIESLTASLA